MHSLTQVSQQHLPLLRHPQHVLHGKTPFNLLPVFPFSICISQPFYMILTIPITPFRKSLKHSYAAFLL